MIARIIEKISVNLPETLTTDLPEAAVLIPVTNEDKPDIILTRRSRHMKTHGGQVAFPGGMRDNLDENLKATALRESKEEIGLDSYAVNIIGRLNEVLSKHHIKVSPFVGLVDPSAKLTPCPEELDSLFKVPIDFFLENPPDRIDKLGVDRFRGYAPCWYFGEYEIWGMSAIILMDFFRVTFDLQICSEIG